MIEEENIMRNYNEYWLDQMGNSVTSEFNTDRDLEHVINFQAYKNAVECLQYCLGPTRDVKDGAIKRCLEELGESSGTD